MTQFDVLKTQLAAQILSVGVNLTEENKKKANEIIAKTLAELTSPVQVVQ